jgi:hypothetical protein
VYRDGLQYHHRIPFAERGPTTVDNLELRCPAHNAYEAERWFGPLFVRETGGRVRVHRIAQREDRATWSGTTLSDSELNRAKGLDAFEVMRLCAQR